MHIQTSDLWQIFSIVISSGRIPVWISRVSVGAVRKAPLMASVAILCILVSCHATLTDPVFHLAPGFFCGGLYHISAP